MPSNTWVSDPLAEVIALLQPRSAYSRALELEWEPELQATIVTNRAESTMAAGDLGLAIRDYRLALALSRSATTQALASTRQAERAAQDLHTLAQSLQQTVAVYRL